MGKFRNGCRLGAGLLAMATLVTPVTASTISGGGKVTAVYVYDNKGLVDTSGGHTPPACAASTNWAFDLTTLAGQAKYATAMTAYATKGNVQVIGTGTCADWGDRETIDSIGLLP